MLKPQSAFFERHGSARHRRPRAGAGGGPGRRARWPCSTPSAATSARRWRPTRGLPRARPARSPPTPLTRLAVPGLRLAARRRSTLAAATVGGVFVLALTSNPEGAQVQHAPRRDGRSGGRSRSVAARGWPPTTRRRSDWAAGRGWSSAPPWATPGRPGRPRRQRARAGAGVRRPGRPAGRRGVRRAVRRAGDVDAGCSCEQVGPRRPGPDGGAAAARRAAA